MHLKKQKKTNYLLMKFMILYIMVKSLKTILETHLIQVA